MGRVLLRRPIVLYPTTLDNYESWSVPGTARQIYVSAAGNDANDGLTTSTPKLTIAAGKALMRNGFGDILYLRRGDTFTAQAYGSCTISGASNTERLIITAYGDESLARPIVRVPSGSAFFSMYSTTVAYSNWRIESVEFLPDSRVAGGSGSMILIGTDGGANFTIQDCYIHGCQAGVEIAGTDAKITNVLIHRNTIADTYTSDVGQGLITAKVDGLTITGNMFDRCGWEDSAFTEGAGDKRNFYCQSNCDNVVCDDNYSLRSASNGAQLRAGGDFNRNVLWANTNGARYGITNSGASYPYPYDDAHAGPFVGVTGTVNHNLIGDSVDIIGPSAAADGSGLELGYCLAVTAVGNIIQNCTSAIGDGYGLQINGRESAPTSSPVPQPITELAVSDTIVYNSDRPLRVWGTPSTQITGVTIDDCVFHTLQTDTSGRVVSAVDTVNVSHTLYANNRYHSARTSSQWFRDGSTDRSLASWQSVVEASALGTVPSYSDPGRTLADYLDFLESDSGSTLADFYTALRAQRKGNWNTRLETTYLINYVRAGYDLAALP